VLVVPRGSGNDFARALNLRSAKNSIAAWEKFVSGAGSVRLVDVGTINVLATDVVPAQEHFFCTVAGVGIDGAVARRANRLPRWLRGNGGYVFTLLPTIFQFAPFPMRIILDGVGKADFRPTVLAAFANVSSFGGGMKIAPKAQPDDGRLDVCLIRDIDAFKLLCVFPTVYFGRHLGLKEVEYSQAKNVRIETEHPFDVYADGEYVCQTPVEVSLRRNALPVIVPE
jgi:diacylglycerol kinase (ATP)